MQNSTIRFAPSRRDLLRLTAGAAGTLCLQPFARALAAPRRAPASGPKLVLLNLKGGFDGLNTVVPDHLTPYFERRPTLALRSTGSTPTLSLNEGPTADASWRLHPSLVGLRDRWLDGELAIVLRVGYPSANESHFESERIYSRARRDISAVTGPDASGWIARLVSEIDPRPTAAIAVGSGSPEDFRGGSTPLLSLPTSLTSFRFEVDNPYATTNDPHRKQTVRAMLQQFSGSPLARAVRDAQLLGHELEESVRLADEGYTSSVSYPSSSLGTALRTVAKLVQGGFETRVYYLTRGGYDTHGAQPGTLAALHTQMDQALAAFRQDLVDMGAWDDVVIAVVSEFGRRNFENGSDGTDHGAGNCALLLGGSIQGGMYGPAVEESHLLASRLAYGVDFRSIFEEIASVHFGLGSSGLASVFPEPPQIPTSLGFLS